MTLLVRRTYGEHFEFAEVHAIVDQRELDDDVSEPKSLFADVRTLDADRGAGRHRARVLTTQRVVPQNRCVLDRVVVGQTDDELVRSVSYKQANTLIRLYRKPSPRKKTFVFRELKLGQRAGHTHPHVNITVELRRHGSQ